MHLLITIEGNVQTLPVFSHCNLLKPGSATRRPNNKTVHLLHNPVHHWFMKEKCGHVIKHGCQLGIIFSTLADLIGYQTGSVLSCAAQLRTLYFFGLKDRWPTDSTSTVLFVRTAWATHPSHNKWYLQPLCILCTSGFADFPSLSHICLPWQFIAIQFHWDNPICHSHIHIEGNIW